MTGAVLDALLGKECALQIESGGDVLENHVILLESAGPCIRVGIKTRDPRNVDSWIEPRYPFVPPPEHLREIPQGRWRVAMRVASPTEMTVEFKGEGEAYELKLEIVDPGARPMQVKVAWRTLP